MTKQLSIYRILVNLRPLKHTSEDTGAAKIWTQTNYLDDLRRYGL
ncbi:MAG: hypothetical protein V2I33_22205 [Kangiellaceae bacterium]|nr:hypothetical protein [Kangiellaceae bacterium]